MGPTAVEQSDRHFACVAPETVEQLRQMAVSKIPELADLAVVGTYAGLRPATQHRDYQIKAHHSKSWITVAGIRSTGLSASLGIAGYVAALYNGEPRVCRREGCYLAHLSLTMLSLEMRAKHGLGLHTVRQIKTTPLDIERMRRMVCSSVT